ncbi:hypothetical protein ACWD5F_29365 [Streptomyces sp. NPDC002499]
MHAGYRMPNAAPTPLTSGGRAGRTERRVLSTGLGEVPQFRRDLQDGDYNFRFQVVNSGGRAWQAKIRILVNGEPIADVDQVGILDGKQRF